MKAAKGIIIAAMLVALLGIATFSPPAWAELAPPTGTLAGSNADASFISTLRQFVTEAGKDDAIRSLITKHKLTVEYTVSDMHTRFYMCFADGNFCTGFGAAPHDCNLFFVSSARVLEQFLRGDDCNSDMNITTHLSLASKIKLRKDLKTLRAALARVYAASWTRNVTRNLAMQQSSR